MRGRLRFGAADDLALTQLPGVLRDFRQLYPHINLELTVNQSGVLQRRLKAGQLDLVFIRQAPGSSGGRLVRRPSGVACSGAAPTVLLARDVVITGCEIGTTGRRADADRLVGVPTRNDGVAVGRRRLRRIGRRIVPPQAWRRDSPSTDRPVSATGPVPRPRLGTCDRAPVPSCCPWCA